MRKEEFSSHLGAPVLTHRPESSGPKNQGKDLKIFLFLESQDQAISARLEDAGENFLVFDSAENLATGTELVINIEENPVFVPVEMKISLVQKQGNRYTARILEIPPLLQPLWSQLLLDHFPQKMQ